MGKLTIKKFRDALKDSMGCITTIAKSSQVNRLTIYRLLEKFPYLKKELEDEVNRITDLVEKNLKVLALKSDMKAIKFYLETKGKDRGYMRTQKIDVESDNKTEMSISEAYKKHLEGKKQ